MCILVLEALVQWLQHEPEYALSSTDNVGAKSQEDVFRWRRNDVPSIKIYGSLTLGCKASSVPGTAQ